MSLEGKQSWGEYSQLVLNKLEELHTDSKDVKKQLDAITERLAKLEAGSKDIKDLEIWQKEVTETWSPRQMKEVKDEVYKQKEKWTGVWFVFIAVQVIWGIILVFKDKIFE
jgi:hypothetical protein